MFQAAYFIDPPLQRPPRLPAVHPVPITIFFPTIIFPRVGLPRNLFIGSLTAALRFSKGSVRKDLNLVMGIGCSLVPPPC